MSAHTPGPWVVVNDGTDDEPMMTVKAARVSGKPPRHCVAICATGDSPQAMENANARLIAAAPTMLDALRAAESTLAAIHPSIVGLPDHPTLVVIRAAIAKAEGRS